MKVIILKTNEVKDVALGYAVNYLLPKKLAVVATKKKLEDLKKKEKEAKLVQKKSKLEDRQMADKLDGKVVKMKVKAGKSGKVHGSITKKELANELKILKSNVVLEKPIKKIGEYEVGLKFGSALAKFKLKLISEE